MSYDEFLDAQLTARAEAELRDQHGEVIDALLTANAAASEALSKATLLYGPVECGPAINIEMGDVQIAVANAMRGLRDARLAVSQAEKVRLEGERRRRQAART